MTKKALIKYKFNKQDGTDDLINQIPIEIEGEINTDLVMKEFNLYLSKNGYKLIEVISFEVLRND